MRTGRMHDRGMLPLLLALFSLLLHTISAASQPGVTRKEFKNLIEPVQYFDDSDVVIVTDPKDGIVYRSEDGGSTWDPIKDLGEGEVLLVIMNPHDNKVAVALGRNHNHWITKDQGDHWRKFELKDAFPSLQSAPPLSFHATDSDRIIMNTRSRTAAEAYYTIDGFESDPKVLQEDTLRCLWAKETAQFTTGDKEDDKSRILCVSGGKYSSTTDAQRLLISDSYFKDAWEPNMEGERPVQGIVSVVAARGFILAARSTTGTAEMALYVTTDTKTWHRASFGEHQIKEGGYTIMDSTNYSLQVDVRIGPPSSPPMGALFTSNSHGYNFLQNEKFTNRIPEGFVDFEKVTNIQGIVLVNIVENAEDVQKGDGEKILVSKISFDDGRNFQDMKNLKDEVLHLHSVTEATNLGTIFSSPAPGILMGVGNTGKHLESYAKGALYVSDNAGVSWKWAIAGPHKYEIGDQGSILVAVSEGENGKFQWSENHGKDWQALDLKDVDDIPDDAFWAQSLTTIPDSTSQKFIMKATTGHGTDTKLWLYTIDFGKLDRRECKQDDFERWPAVVDKEGKPACIMGRTQTFRRRKADAKCFVGVKFKDPEPEYDHSQCECTVEDYECDLGFKRSEDRKSCIPDSPRQPKSDQCKSGDKTFKDTNGFRKIPGNECTNGDKIAGEVDRECNGETSKPVTSDVTHELHEFEADQFAERFYLERTATSTADFFGFPDETVVIRTVGNRERAKIYITHDHGKKWRPVLEDEEIGAIYPHQYFNDRVYFITSSKKVFYSANRGKVINSFEAPGTPVRDSLIMRFHQKHEEWLLWMSCADNERPCMGQSYYSTRNGERWEPLLKGVDMCEFVWQEGRETSNKTVFCGQRPGEDREVPLQLVSSEDWFIDDKKVLFENMINFATMSEFIVVATKEGKDSAFLNVDSSIDAKNFAGAQFPHNLKVPHSTAYTVLDSSTHSIFLHVTISSESDHEYGTIIKSNSNGTSYTKSLENVNRNSAGYVDFEKITSLEGLAIANIVSNVGDLKNSRKKLQTVITHNDGGAWDLIAPPAKNGEGKAYSCPDGSKREKCALHLHGYTEREDFRDTYASASAVGIMLGKGNVGSSLTTKSESDTFITSDGGITWKFAKKGPHMWEFGDQGGIIVLVPDKTATKIVYYTLDYGEKWLEYPFSEYDITISDITTVPSDTSMNFLLWGTGRDRQLVSINLDFSGLAPEPCKGLDNPDSSGSDYITFTPSHPHQKNNCLFGGVWQYYRKNPKSRCHNGPLLNDKALYRKKESCKCTREDFECDYNYERTSDGGCKLVPGLKPMSREEFCKDYPEAETFYRPTGYRRLPLSICEGGIEYDKNLDDYEPCPGKEPEFLAKHRGISRVGLFFAIVIPFTAAAGVGYWLYNNAESKFGMGQIRLGDTEGGRFGALRGSGRGDWTKYPVMAISAVVAVGMAIPMVAMAVFRWAKETLPSRRRGGWASSGPYNSRGSFARRGRDYISVGGQDENDLLGEDSDEDA